MVAGKPATNSLLLTSQQTGTVQPGQSVRVSISFAATSVGRWTHELAVRNLGNKHDQASDTRSFPGYLASLASNIFSCPSIRLSRAMYLPGVNMIIFFSFFPVSGVSSSTITEMLFENPPLPGAYTFFGGK